MSNNLNESFDVSGHNMVRGNLLNLFLSHIPIFVNNVDTNTSIVSNVHISGSISKACAIGTPQIWLVVV